MILNDQDDDSEQSQADTAAVEESAAFEGNVVEDDTGQLSRSIGTFAAFSGPLPHPALVEYYERVLPGSAERIFSMTEKQLDNDISLDQADVAAAERLQDSEIASFRRSQWFTFILVLAFLGLATFAISQGQTITSVAAGLGALGTIAYALRGRKRQDADGPPQEEQPTAE